ncbi:deoxyguanosinetriphosphate triphosphohydrolase [Salinarchaeum sp. Harcht-Bsk1]|nr:deoxyguanosinetriphosphate triphosphohydrolase [Salinarchaeum sp. Harcht-Bsk1]
MSSELIERYLGRNSDTTFRIDPSIAGGLEIEESLIYEVKLLQFLCKYYVFENPALVAQQHGHTKLIKELYDTLYEASAENSMYADMIPDPFDEKISMLHEGELGYSDIDAGTIRARLVADVIASMTEQQAMQLYERVTGRSPGLVTDRII